MEGGYPLPHINKNKTPGSLFPPVNSRTTGWGVSGPRESLAGAVEVMAAAAATPATSPSAATPALSATPTWRRSTCQKYDCTWMQGGSNENQLAKMGCHSETMASPILGFFFFSLSYSIVVFGVSEEFNL